MLHECEESVVSEDSWKGKKFGINSLRTSRTHELIS